MSKDTKLDHLQKLAKAEARIKSLINKETRAYNEFVQAATEFHKPGLTNTKKGIEDVQSSLAEMQEAQMQKALSKIPEVNNVQQQSQPHLQPQPQPQPQSQPPTESQPQQPQQQHYAITKEKLGTDNFFGLVATNDGKLVFGISVYCKQFQITNMNEIRYQILIEPPVIKALKKFTDETEDNSTVNYTGSLLQFINNNHAHVNKSAQVLQNYKKLIEFSIKDEIEMLREPAFHAALAQSGINLSKFKKYPLLSSWYNLPTVEDALQAYQNQLQTQAKQNEQQQDNQQMLNVIQQLQNAEPQQVIDFKSQRPNDWQRLEQFSPQEMKRIHDRVFTPREQTASAASPETSHSSIQSSIPSSQSDQSFSSPLNEPITIGKQGKGLKLLKGLNNNNIFNKYKRLTVLLGAAKTGVRDENRTEFTQILDKLMGKRLIDKRARDLLLSRFNTI